jgi:hypothetical protein
MSKREAKRFDAENITTGSTIEPNSGCWIWNGSVFWDGYGQFNFKQDGLWKKARAHRASYEIFVGSAAGMVVCHRCDNPPCVNPDHLFLGTQLDNIRDMDAKGRRVKTTKIGERHPFAKLTEDQACAIRFNEVGTTQEIASRYGVSWSAVKSIRIGRTWRHLCRAA